MHTHAERPMKQPLVFKHKSISMKKKKNSMQEVTHYTLMVKKLQQLGVLPQNQYSLFKKSNLEQFNNTLQLKFYNSLKIQNSKNGTKYYFYENTLFRYQMNMTAKAKYVIT